MVYDRATYLRMPAEQWKAHHAVARAVKDGTLVRPDACEHCGRQTRIHAHHHRGYTPEHRLDVRWLCQPCHEADHHPQPEREDDEVVWAQLRGRPSPLSSFLKTGAN